MAKDKEQEIRLHFLAEAEEYLDNLESDLLGLGSNEVSGQKIDSMLRSAHSIKGGAAMMGFQTLSTIAHRLEPRFRTSKCSIKKYIVLKSPKIIPGQEYFSFH